MGIPGFLNSGESLERAGFRLARALGVLGLYLGLPDPLLDGDRVVGEF